MKIIILAAGIGSRLGNPFPKPLTPLKDGKSIMQRQINNITTYFDVNDITTVVGFKKNKSKSGFFSKLLHLLLEDLARICHGHPTYSVI